MQQFIYFMIIKPTSNNIAKYNFPNHIDGDTFSGGIFKIRDTRTGQSIDITNCVIKIDFKLDYSSPIAFTFSTTNGRVSITNASSGEFRINQFILNETPNRYIYDCEFTFVGGKVKTYFNGYLTILNDVTNG